MLIYTVYARYARIRGDTRMYLDDMLSGMENL